MPDKQSSTAIVLVRNYLPDKQESMKRFADMLQNGLIKKGVEVINWYPVVLASSVTKYSFTNWTKWLGYIDKWIVFPLLMRYRLVVHLKKYRAAHFHICDHSNAPYLAYLPRERTSITCHDVLAIRGALGFEDAYCPSTKFGIILQKWILRNLVKSRKIACVSHLTHQQLVALAPDISKEKNWCVIHNGFNAEFAILSSEETKRRLQTVAITTEVPYILHVGSDLPRKNRKMLVDMVKQAGSGWQGNICFAGQALEPTLTGEAKRYGIYNRIISVVEPNHDTLVALYNGCEAFVFPSYSEGFGWPIIEAQACGAPVIASNTAPLPEVSGGAALHVSPDDSEGFSEALLSLQNENLREKLVDEGKENTKRFSPDLMIDNYLDLFFQDIKDVSRVSENN